MGIFAKIKNKAMLNSIFELAKYDNYIKSFPVRETETNFNLTRGQKIIMNDKQFDSLGEFFSQIRFLKEKRDDLLNQMLSKQKLFDRDLLKTEDKIKTLQSEINELEALIIIEKESISFEEQELLARGFSLPKNSKNEVVLEEVQLDNGLFPKKRANRKKIKKIIYLLSGIIILELFFGLALWDTMRDSKSFFTNDFENCII
jgi:hypothetical protein